MDMRRPLLGACVLFWIGACGGDSAPGGTDSFEDADVLLDAGNAVDTRAVEEIADEPSDIVSDTLPSPEDGADSPDRPLDSAEEGSDVTDATDATDASPPEPDAGGADPGLDELLQFQHLQALGTHNSYHVEPLTSWIVGEWAYTHLPLNEQAELQGVRQFELDMYYRADEGTFDVHHIPLVDQDTNCATFQECLSHLKLFSDASPEHHPLVILMEVKSELVTMDPASLLADLEARTLEIWPEERLIRPDDVRGDSPNLRDAIGEKGWPSLGTLRGRLLLVLHAGGELRDVYTENLTTTADRVFFPDCFGDVSLPISAVHSINDPLDSLEKIQEVVAAGHLVRTRGDADSEEAENVDYARFQAALESGAHFISTDYPFPGDEETYGVVIPEGNPSRCNPITAPPECSAEAIEAL